MELIIMQKGLAGRKCQKCGSTIMLREEAVLQGPAGVWSHKSKKVITLICNDCGFMELYYKGKSIWK